MRLAGDLRWLIRVAPDGRTHNRRSLAVSRAGERVPAGCGEMAARERLAEKMRASTSPAAERRVLSRNGMRQGYNRFERVWGDI